MRRVLSLVGSFVVRLQRGSEPSLRRWFPRLVAAIVALGVLAANPPPAVGAAGSGERVELVGSVTSSSVFVGSDIPGRDGVEASARQLATASGGLPVEAGRFGPWVRSAGALVGTDRCPPSELVVSWVPPVGAYEAGAHVEPLGPPPTERTTDVNGVVLCRASTFAYLGFEAAWDGARWRLVAVPSLADEDDGPLLEGEADAVGATPAAGGSDAGDGVAALPSPTAWAGVALEPLAAYVPQTTCDPPAKAGVLGFRDLLLSAYPGTRNLGIGRVCEAEGVSEHKEGRAFDWGVRADDPAELAAAHEVLSWMLSPEPGQGPGGSAQPHAIARRLGLMYVIWNGSIWSAFHAAEGWRPYVGVSNHRDHIHFSFDWPGALAQTTFWRGGRATIAAGSTVPDLPLVPIAPRTGGLPLGVVPPVAPVTMPPGLFGPPAPSSQGGASEPREQPTTTSTSPAPTSTTTSTTPSPSPSESPTTSTTTTTSPPTVTVPSTPPPTLGFSSR